MDNQYKSNEIIDVCLLAGKIILESGAETDRVEDTMIRMAAAFGREESHSFSTPTAIIFSLDGENSASRLIRISKRSTDLRKVALVNSISRAITNKEMNLHEAYVRLKELEKANLAYPIWVQIVAAFMVSGSFTIMFDGQWHDFIWACLAGGLGYACFLFFDQFLEVKFFAEFIAALVIGFVAFFMIDVGLGRELDKIVIGAVMPLVPGLLITNAARDLISGHLMSALLKLTDAGLTALAIGSGVAVVLIML
jgi:uncharacterized membrane protein YjjP (DUF1212 family)